MRAACRQRGRAVLPPWTGTFPRAPENAVNWTNRRLVVENIPACPAGVAPVCHRSRLRFAAGSPRHTTVRVCRKVVAARLLVTGRFPRSLRTDQPTVTFCHGHDRERRGRHHRFAITSAGTILHTEGDCLYRFACDQKKTRSSRRDQRRGPADDQQPDRYRVHPGLRRGLRSTPHLAQGRRLHRRTHRL